jgi:hypothetical protein
VSYLRIGLLIAVLLNVACGETAGDSTTTSQVVTTTSSSTSTTTTTPTPPIPVLSDLTGTWVNERAVLQVNDAGDYIVLGPDSDPEQPLTLGFVARDDVNVIFVSGVNGECPGQTGVYNAGVDADTLTLTLVDDPCAARTQWFELPFILEQ